MKWIELQQKTRNKRPSTNKIRLNQVKLENISQKQNQISVKMLIKSLGTFLYCVCSFLTKKSETLNYMSQTQLNFLGAFVNTASKQYSNISLSEKSFGMITLFIYVDAKIDVVVSKFISILPVLKTSITGAPVDNTRKFFSCSFEEFSKYPNKNCLVFSSSTLCLSWKLKIFRTLVAVNFSLTTNSSSK